MAQPLPRTRGAFIAMFMTITQKVDKLRQEAGQLLNEAEILNQPGKVAEAAIKISEAREKIDEAERLSGKAISNIQVKRETALFV